MIYATENSNEEFSKLRTVVNLHLGTVREVTGWDSVLLLDLGEDHRKLVDQVMLLGFFAEDGWHLLLQIADDVCVSLGKERQSR